MPLADYEELDTTALKISQVAWGGDVIRKSFGGGNKRKINVGTTYGRYKWKLTNKNHTPGEGYGLTINSLTRFDYYLDFFQRFTTGEDDVFVVGFRSKKWTVRLSETNFNAEPDRILSELFKSIGVEIEYAFVPGETDYDTDGSLIGPDTEAPSVPTGLGLELL